MAALRPLCVDGLERHPTRPASGLNHHPRKTLTHPICCRIRSYNWDAPLAHDDTRKGPTHPKLLAQALLDLHRVERVARTQCGPIYAQPAQLRTGNWPCDRERFRERERGERDEGENGEAHE